ncbi:unnamed protein product [Chrysoparadoxa australica]
MGVQGKGLWCLVLLALYWQGAAGGNQKRSQPDGSGQRKRMPLSLLNQVVTTTAGHDFDDVDASFHAAADFTHAAAVKEGSAAPYLACTAYSGASAIAASLRSTFGSESVKTVHAHRSTGYSCFMVEANPAEAETVLQRPSSRGLMFVEPWPSCLKLHGTVLRDVREDLVQGLHIALRPGHGKKDASLRHRASTPLSEELDERWRQGLAAATDEKRLHELIFWTSPSPDVQDHHRGRAEEDEGGPPSGNQKNTALWTDAVQQLHAMDNASEQCGWNQAVLSHATHGLLSLSNIGHLVKHQVRGDPSSEHHACLLGLLGYLSAQHEVESITMHGRPMAFNYVATSIIQGGSDATIGNRPYWDAGLTGDGELVGVIDTGLDDASCFFKDPINGPTPRSTPEDPITDMAQRKVVQYIGFPHGFDTWQGHGTHVAGSVAGSIYDAHISPACDVGETLTCWGACMTDDMCSANQYTSGTTADTCAEAIGDAEFTWAFYCPAYNCDIKGNAAADPCGTDVAETRAQGTGSAPDAQIAFFDANDPTIPDLPEGSEGALALPEDLNLAFNPAYDAGARIHSNSWGQIECFYDGFSLQVDAYAIEHPDLLLVFAAGNSGANGGCTVSSPGSGKNVLTVGATENGPSRGLEGFSVDSTDQVAFFSSRGPTFDGRLKPELVAPGFFVFSAEAAFESQQGAETCAVTANAGTSMATPLTSGAAAIARQYFKGGTHAANLNASGLCGNAAYTTQCSAMTPSGVVLKAVLINSAGALSGTSQGPNNDEGHGLLNLSLGLPLSGSATNLYVTEASIATQSSKFYTFTVAADSAVPLMATLTWMDPVGAISTSLQLLHDLDLVIEGPDCAIYYSNGLAGLEFWNNAEKVVIPNPTAGEYTIRVMANELTESDSQTYGLAITGEGVISEPAESVTDPGECASEFVKLTTTDIPEAGVACHPVLTDCCVPLSDWIADGYCDGDLYNTEACAWDGGDCCPWTCPREWRRQGCGSFGYDCKDPNWSECTEENLHYIGDGDCDMNGIFNTALCGFDGGDCCKDCCDPIATGLDLPWLCTSASNNQCRDSNCNGEL